MPQDLVAAVVILTVLSCAWSVARGGVGGNGPGRARVGWDGSENAPVSDGAIARKEDGWDGWDGEAGHAPLVGERRRRRLAAQHTHTPLSVCSPPGSTAKGPQQ